jgi:hypothetical protein
MDFLSVDAYGRGMTSILLSDFTQRLGVAGLAVVLLLVGVGFALAGEDARPRTPSPGVPVQDAQSSDSVIARPGWAIVPGGHHHVITSATRRPARTAGSPSARRRVSSREPVR